MPRKLGSHIDPSLIMPEGSARSRKSPDVYVDDAYMDLMLADVPESEVRAAVEEDVASEGSDCEERSDDEEDDDDDSAFIEEDEDDESERESNYDTEETSSEDEDEDDCVDTDDEEDSEEEQDPKPAAHKPKNPRESAKQSKKARTA